MQPHRQLGQIPVPVTDGEVVRVPSRARLRTSLLRQPFVSGGTAAGIGAVS